MEESVPRGLGGVMGARNYRGKEDQRSSMPRWWSREEAAARAQGVRRNAFQETAERDGVFMGAWLGDKPEWRGG